MPLQDLPAANTPAPLPLTSKDHQSIDAGSCNSTVPTCMYLQAQHRCLPSAHAGLGPSLSHYGIDIYCSSEALHTPSRAPEYNAESCKYVWGLLLIVIPMIPRTWQPEGSLRPCTL